MLLTRSTYNQILEYSLNQSSTIFSPAIRLGLAGLDENGILRVLDVSRIPLGNFEIINGKYRNTDVRFFVNDTISTKYVSHVVFLSASNDILGAARIKKGESLAPGERLALQKNEITFKINQDEELLLESNLGPIEASAVSNTFLLGQVVTETSTGSRFFAYLSVIADASAFGVNGFGQLNGILSDNQITIPRVTAEATSVSSLTGDAISVRPGNAVGVASLTSFASGFVDVIAAAGGAGPLVSTAAGEVIVPGVAIATVNLTGDADGLSATFATASATISFTGLAIGLVDINAAAGGAGPLIGVAIGDVRVFADASGVAELTASAQSLVDVPAAASSAGPLVGVADGNVTLLRGFGDATASLSSVADSLVVVSATADSTASLSDAPGADGGTIPLLITPNTLSLVSGQGSLAAPLEGDTLETDLGVWASDPVIPNPSGYTVIWRRLYDGNRNNPATWTSTPGYTNDTHNIQGDGGLRKTGLTGFGNSAYQANNVEDRIEDTGGLIQFRSRDNIGVMFVGLSTNPQEVVTSYFESFDYAIGLSTTTLGEFSIYENGVEVLSGLGSYGTSTNFRIERLYPSQQVVYLANGEVLRVSPILAPPEVDLIPVVSIITSDGELREMDVIKAGQDIITGDATNNQYTITALDIGFQIDVRIQVDNGYTQNARLMDIRTDSADTGAVSNVFPATASATSLLDGNALGGVAGTGIADDASASLTGAADGTTVMFASASSAADLTGNSEASVTAFGVASSTSELTTSANSLSLVPAAASSAGPLVGVADGNVTLLRVSASATALLTVSAVATVDVPAEASSTADLTGDSDGFLSRQPGVASATAELTGDADANAVSEAIADSTTSLTGDAAAGTVPLNLVAPVVSGNEVVTEELSVSNGTWASDPALQAGDYSYQWRRTNDEPYSIQWAANAPYTPEADGGLTRTGSGNQTTFDNTRPILAGEAIRAHLDGTFVAFGFSSDVGGLEGTLDNLVYMTTSRAIVFRGNGVSAGLALMLPVGEWIEIERATNGTDLIFRTEGGEVRTRAMVNPSLTQYPVAWISSTSGSIIDAGIQQFLQENIVGATSNTYTLTIDDVNADIDCFVTVNNGFGGDISIISNAVGPISGTINAEASATAGLTGDADSFVDVPAAASSAGPLVGVANGILSRQPGVADATASLTGDADGTSAVDAAVSSTAELTGDADGLVARLYAIGNGTSSLTGAAASLVDVPAAASSAGPLVGVADGFLSRQPGVADATASLTGDTVGGVAGTGIADDAIASLTGFAQGTTIIDASAVSFLELTSISVATTIAFGNATTTSSLTSSANALSLVPAAASSAGPLVGVANGILSRQPGVADATASLTGDATGSTEVNAVASSAGPLVGVANGIISRQPGVADATASLTGSVIGFADVPAAASSAGPLVGVADGNVTLLRALTSANALLTVSAVATVDVIASASSTAELISNSEGLISRQPAIASSASSLTGDSDGSVESSATADSSTLLTGYSEAGTVPINTVLPVITGDLIVAEELSVSNGTWVSDPTLQSEDFTYQWRREDIVSGAPTWNVIPAKTGTIDLTGGTPQKTAGTVGYSDNGSYTTQSISGTGLFEFTAAGPDGSTTSTLTRIRIGLSTNAPLLGGLDDPSQEFDYAFEMFFRSGQGTSLSSIDRTRGSSVEGSWTSVVTLRINVTDSNIEWYRDNVLVRTETRNHTGDLYGMFTSQTVGGEIVTNNFEGAAIVDITGATSNVYTLTMDDVDANLDCVVTVNNGFGGDQIVIANLVGPISGTIEAIASSTSSLTGSANSLSLVPAAASSAGPLVGSANGILSRQPGVASSISDLIGSTEGNVAAFALASSTGDLTGDSNASVVVFTEASSTADLISDASGNLSLLPGVAEATSSLSGSATAISNVNAAASSAGPLVGSANGVISRQPGVADATASLTGDATGSTDVNAAASSAGPLVGVADGNVTLLRGFVDGNAILIGDSDAFSVVFALASGTAELTSSTNGILSRQPGVADATASLTGDTVGNIVIIATASSSADLTGNSNGEVPIILGVATAGINLTSSVVGHIRVFATASSAVDLTESSDGSVTLLRGVADATADLTESANGVISRQPGVANATANLTSFADSPFSIIDNRGFEFIWDARDVVSGQAWVDRVSNYSAAWSTSGPATITLNQSTTGANPSAIGVDRVDKAVRMVGGTLATWESSFSSAVAQPAGTSVWLRMIARLTDPNINLSTNHTWFEIRDSVEPSGIEILRATQFNSQGGDGGGGVLVYNGGASNLTGAQVSDTPDTRGDWSIHDLYLDGATCTMTYAANGKFASATRGEQFVALEGPRFQLCRLPNSDVIAICLAFGTAADEWSQALHNADLALLQGS